MTHFDKIKKNFGLSEIITTRPSQRECGILFALINRQSQAELAANHCLGNSPEMEQSHG